MDTLRVLGAISALSILSACSGGGIGSSPAPLNVAPITLPPSAPIAPASVQMNPLTSYTVYVGSTDGTSVSTELSVLSSGGPSPTGGYRGAMPLDLLTTGTPQQPAAAAGAVVGFPDGSTVTADALGNFDASQSPWAIANQASIAAGQQVEVIVDATNVAASAAPLDTFVDADEPSGGLVSASEGRGMLTASVASPAPVVLAKLQVLPSSSGMYDKEQRMYFAIGLNAANKAVALGKQNVLWTVGNCAGGAAAGKLVATDEASKIIYRSPSAGSAGNCPDVLTASYKNPSSATALNATAKAYYASRQTAVLYSGKALDSNGRPVVKGIVDFFASTASSSTGRIVAATDADGKFSQKIPAGRTPSFLVANRVTTTKGFTYQFFNVIVSAPASSTTGLTLTETTPTSRPTAGV